MHTGWRTQHSLTYDDAVETPLQDENLPTTVCTGRRSTFADMGRDLTLPERSQWSTGTLPPQ